MNRGVVIKSVTDISDNAADLKNIEFLKNKLKKWISWILKYKKKVWTADAPVKDDLIKLKDRGKSIRNKVINLFFLSKK